MNQKEKRLSVIFKLVKKGDGSYSYKFDSLAIIKKEAQSFTVLAGKFARYTDSYFDKIYADDKMLVRSTSNIVIADPRKNVSKYAIYEVPEEIFKHFDNHGLKKFEEQLIALYAMAQSMDLVWYGEDKISEFKAYRGDVRLYTNVTIKEIYEMLVGKEGIIKLENNKTILKGKDSQGLNTALKPVMQMDLSGINIEEVIAKVKAKIIGQDEAVEAVVSNIYANQRIVETGNKDLISTQKAAILLDGPTGTGKTAICKEVADILSLPVVITSITNYSSTGYVGGTLTDILVKLLDKTKGDLELAQRGIVCLDEIDKLGQDPNSNNKLAIKTAVQQELLTYLSGAKFDIEYGGKTIEFDTSNLTFIGMGAFNALREQKIAEKKSTTKSKSIGFVQEAEGENQEQSDNTYEMTQQDYINFGLERELVGRFLLLTSTKAYTVEDYKQILVNSSLSPLKMFIEFCKTFGIQSVTYDEEFIQMAAEIAYKDNFGARGLQKIMSNLKNMLLLDIMSKKFQTLHLTTDMLKKMEEKNIRQF